MLTAFKGPEAGHLVVVDEGGQVKRKRFSWIFFYKKVTLSSMLLHRPGFGATMTMVSLALVTPDAGSEKIFFFFF